MIPFFDYRPENERIRGEIDDAIRRVLDSGRLILGPEVAAFEEEFAAFVGARGAVGVNSGTDALILALRALSISRGDEVITVANAGVPVVAAIRAVGALPRFVDIDEDSMLLAPELLEAATTDRTRCVIPVHLYGRPAAMEPIREVAQRHDYEVIEDCAQAHGARLSGRYVGTFGRIGCFSFYPTKNLGAIGDGGICVSNDLDCLERLRALRMYGFDEQRVSQVEGINTRLDELQAAVLRAKLPHLPERLSERLRLAERYLEGLSGGPLGLPSPAPGVDHAYHLFVARHPERDRLLRELSDRGIGGAVHYSQPVHLMPAYRPLGLRAGDLPRSEAACGSVLSLPLYPGLATDDVDRVIDVLLQTA